MRVIAGTARSITLVAPKNKATRPTVDRLKENLFNMLSSHINGSCFLDLFSGSGAIGIEALSRGASLAVFVENTPAALDAIQVNLHKTRLNALAEVLPLSVEEGIKYLGNNNRRFDIIFMDPPYGKNHIPITLKQLAEASLLNKNGILVTETHAHEDTFIQLYFAMQREKIYSDTKFAFYTEAKV